MKVALLSLADPHGKPTGGTLRVRAIEKALTALGIETHLVFPQTPITSDEEASEAAATASLGEKYSLTGVRALKRKYLPMPLAIGGRNPELSARLAELKPDVVYLSALSQRTLVPESALCWVDFMDLWSDFATRELETRSGLARVTVRLQSRTLARTERALARKAAAVTAAGARDAEALASTNAATTWLPTPVADALPSSHGHRARRPGRVAGLIGNFHFWPNVEAYERVTSTWLPLLRQEGWTLLVAGIGSPLLPPPPPGVEIIGEVDSVSDFYSRIDVSLAPITLGGGMKVKVVESLMRGVPVIATPHALEGLEVSDPTGIREVSVLSPDLSGLDVLAASTPNAAVLAPYTQDSFTATVGSLMDSLAARVAAR